MASSPPQRRPRQQHHTTAAFLTLFIPIVSSLDLHLVLRAFSGVAWLSTTVWCAVPGPRWGCKRAISPALAAAAHHVKHTAESALDVFESFARDMAASRADSLSFVDLEAVTDTICEIYCTTNLPEAGHLVNSLYELKNRVACVEYSKGDIDSESWKAFSFIDRWIRFMHGEIVRQHDAGVVDTDVLDKLLSQMDISSRGSIDDLIARIDLALITTVNGIKAASEVRRDVLVLDSELVRRQDDRWRSRKVWRYEPPMDGTPERHPMTLPYIQTSITYLQKQLELTKGYLKDHQSNAADFYSEITAMGVLPLEHELQELQLLEIKIQKIISENRGAHDAPNP